MESRLKRHAKHSVDARLAICILTFFSSTSAAPSAPLFLRKADLRRVRLRGVIRGLNLYLNNESAERISRSNVLHQLMGKLSEHPAKTCSSCAVVGGAGSLQRDQLGAYIDGHECVFRTNIAPTDRWAHIVGSKHTFHLLSLPWMGGSPHDTTHVRKKQNIMSSFSRKASNVSVLLIQGLYTLTSAVELLKHRVLVPEYLQVLHPLQQAQLKEMLGKRAGLPSTGLMAVNLARQLCSTPPAVVGFDANSVPFHYYDAPDEHFCDAVAAHRFQGAEHGNQAHNWEIEQKLLQRWHAEGAIKFRPPSKGFSKYPSLAEISACEMPMELRVQSLLGQLNGTYAAMPWQVNSKAVYQRHPTKRFPNEMMLWYSRCGEPSLDYTEGRWAIAGLAALQSRLEITPFLSFGCADLAPAVALSADFRPERPSQAKWKVFHNGTELPHLADIYVSVKSQR
eukprot:TRINITY_DN68021_c0_g1_i1.p1 TRINITY_DN68021_c0_g1~~TRINITY_DN68021_c0_g1_i1.p1  ORF type:complete len:462 (+),score=80.44 TRINITY_DN68021_c0_g1_i1:36-1388(+)